MPRRRPDPFEIRGKQLQQEQRDRQQRQAILATQAAAATPTPTTSQEGSHPLPEASQEAPEWDTEAWRANSRISGLMTARYGRSWASSKSLHKTAERALADLRGAGDGKALRHLIRHATNGTYDAAMDAKFGPTPLLLATGLSITPNASQG